MAKAIKVSSLLRFTESCAAIDPCVGIGTALNLITRVALVDRHGDELDTERTEQARAAGVRVTKGNEFQAHAKAESFSLLYLNPPYDSEINRLKGRSTMRIHLKIVLLIL